MTPRLNRRHFLGQSLLASSTAAVASTTLAAPEPGPAMPTGKIRNLTLSRLISGGNLISGWAHSRDLQYVPSLMRAYNTDARILDTLECLEQHGVNTIIADPRKKPMDLFARYWKERGGKMQWIAEGHPDVADWKTNLQTSIEFGARAVYVQGVIGDRWLKEGRLELLGQCVEFIKSQGVPGGIGAHQIEVIVESERLRFKPDFYVKTCHHAQYWSARRPDQSQFVVDNSADNYWDMDPERTAAVMAEIEVPWIAFKVLAAGAIRPESGFRYAFEHGADFICVGMFDFQVDANCALTTRLVREFAHRDRPWMA